jgi:hypothetical protein
MGLRDMYIGIHLNTTPAIRDLDRLEKKIDKIHTGFNRIGDDTEDVSRGFNQMSSSGGTTFSGLGSKAKKFSAAMGIAAISMAGATAASAPLVGAVGAIAASFAGAGIAAIGFGAVAASVLKPVIGDADNLTKAQQEARNKLEDFQSFWSGFTKQFETPIFEAFGKSLELAEGVISRFAPTITKVSDVVNDMLTGMNNAVNNGGMAGFFSWLETTGVESFRNFSVILGNVTSGFFSMMEAFAPLTTYMEEGLIGLTERFKEWSDSLKNSQSFQNFVSYVQENGPVLLETIGNIAGIVKNLVEDLAPFGSTVLEGIQSFTSYINDNWPTVSNIVVGLGVAVGSFVIMMKGMQIISTINMLMTAWRAGTLLNTQAQWALNASMLANPITWVIAGIAALIAIGVLLWKNWDTVKEKAGQLWDKTKEVFGNIYKWGMEKIQPVVDFFKSLKDKFDDFKSAISNFKMPKWVSSIGNVFSGAASKVKGLFDGSHATGLASVPFDGYTAQLHKDESVLTAKQSNALREAGILKNDGSKPVVDFTPTSAPARQVSSGGGVSTGDIHIHVAGGNSSRETAINIREELEGFFASLSRRVPRVTEG